MKSEKEIKKNPMFLYLAALTVSSTFGLQAWRTLFNNFAVEVAGLDGNHIGVIQSLREVPGFLWVVNYQIPFFGGAAMALISLIATQKISVPRHKVTSTS
jgi:hypothetical protein